MTLTAGPLGAAFGAGAFAVGLAALGAGLGAGAFGAALAGGAMLTAPFGSLSTAAVLAAGLAAFTRRGPLDFRCVIGIPAGRGLGVVLATDQDPGAERDSQDRHEQELLRHQSLELGRDHCPTPFVKDQWYCSRWGPNVAEICLSRLS